MGITLYRGGLSFFGCFVENRLSNDDVFLDYPPHSASKTSAHRRVSPVARWAYARRIERERDGSAGPAAALAAASARTVVTQVAHRAARPLARQPAAKRSSSARSRAARSPRPTHRQ